MRYLARKRILCFSKEELMGLYKSSKLSELIKEIVRRGVSLDDLQRDHSLMKEIATAVGDRTVADRDEHEIFAALLYTDFFEPTSEICFEVNTKFDPETPKIESLSDLNRYRDGVATSDFMINSSDGMRVFQLKRYREGLDTEHLFDFMKDRIQHYANNLGDTNLLIQIQSDPFSQSNVDFQGIHDKLVACGFKFKGQVLVSYNDNNEKYMWVQVYPKLAKSEKPIKFLADQI